jgi:hypothetical protein
MKQNFGGRRFLRLRLKGINIHAAMRLLFLEALLSLAQHDYLPLRRCERVLDLSLWPVR